MTRRNPPAKWVLPEVVNPSSHICYTVPVPNDRQHIAAFLGALQSLGSAYKWQDDTDHTAKDVAQVWRNIIDNLQGCEMFDIRINPVNSCEVQKTFNGGANWEFAFSIRECADLAFNDGLVNAINDGIIAVPTQPKPDGEVPTGMCYEYNVELEGKGIYHLPVPVYDGYTIQCVGAKGMWWNGDILQVWKCPSGDNAPFGECQPDTPDYDAGYPIPDAPSMRLICKIGSEYHDLYNQTVGVPAGTGTAEVLIQANDDNLADNQGAVRFKLIVCAVTLTVSTTPVTVSPNICHIGSVSQEIVGVGDTFTFTPADQTDCPGRGPAGVWDGKFTLSAHATLRVASVTGWSGGSGWQWFSPDNTFSGAPAVDDEQSTLGFAGNSDTQYTIEFEVMSIP